MYNRILIAFAVLCLCLSTAHAQNNPEIFPQLGHSQPVKSVAFSPNGKLLASGSEDKTVKLWDVASGRVLRTLIGHIGGITSVAFSPDGKLLASSSDPFGSLTPRSGDSMIKLWDVASGRELRTLRGHKGGVTSVAFSPDGRVLASGSSDEDIKLWDVASGRELRTLFGAYRVNSIAFSPDGKTLASGEGNTIKLWGDGASGHELRTLSENAGDPDVRGVKSVAFSPNGKVLASVSNDNVIKLWDVASGHEVLLSGHSSKPLVWIESVAFSPNGKVLASSGNGDNTIRLWDVASGRELRSLMGASGLTAVYSVAFSPDGKMLASGNFDNSIGLWNVATGRELRALKGHVGGVHTVAFSPDGKTLASGSWDIKDKTIKLWNMASGRKLRLLSGDLGAGVTSVSFSPDGTMLASGNLDENIKIWDLASGRELRTLAGKWWVLSVAFSPDGKLIASGSNEKTIKLWDVASGRELRTLSGHTGGVNSVAFSPDGKVLASSGNEDSTIRLWDVATGRVLHTLTGKWWADSVAFSPDGKTLASGNHDYEDTIKLWDVVSGRELRTLSGHMGGVTSVAFSPDGKILASGSEDKTIKLWNVASGRELRTLSGTLASVNSVAFAPDGKVLGSGSDDGTTRAWDISSGAERVALIGFEDRSFLVITPEGFFESSSAAAEENLNVRVGTHVSGIGSYREKFYRPDLVKLSLAGNSLNKLGFAGISNVKAAPIVGFINPPLQTSRSKVTINLRLTDGGGGIGLIRLFVNGTAVVQDETLRTSGGAKTSGTGPVTRSYPVQLANGPNELRAIAFNADDSMSATTTTAAIAANLPAVAHSNLHAVVVGIQTFKNPEYNLTYSVADAQLFAGTLRKYTPQLFKTLDISLLTTPAETTRDSVTQALKNMKSKVGPDDVFVFYIASHGIADSGKYFLITSNVDSVDRIETEALSNVELTALIANIPAAKKLVIVDTCQAQALGDALQAAVLTQGMNAKTAATLLSRGIGLTVLSATTTDQEALEGYKNHGLFTYVVAAGLTGKANAKNGVVSTFGLADYVDTEVPPLALNLYKHEQHPTVDMSGQGFPIAKVK